MSKHNYTQYSNKKNENTIEPEIDVVIEPVESVEVADHVIETPEITMVDETVETVTLPETVTGVITGCSKLNVRVAPVAGAEVVCVLDVNTEIEINVANSTDEWFSICTAAGIDGYCMRKFVDASL